jgi:hypothetical protein
MEYQHVYHLVIILILFFKLLLFYMILNVIIHKRKEFIKEFKKLG